MRLYTDTWDQALSLHSEVIEWKNRQVARGMLTIEPNMTRETKNRYRKDMYKYDCKKVHEYRPNLRKVDPALPEESRKNLNHYNANPEYRALGILRLE